jgi:hypothetical protein
MTRLRSSPGLPGLTAKLINEPSSIAATFDHDALTKVK